MYTCRKNEYRLFCFILDWVLFLERISNKTHFQTYYTGICIVNLLAHHTSVFFAGVVIIIYVHQCHHHDTLV